jgi:hypothetical protein
MWYAIPGKADKKVGWHSTLAVNHRHRKTLRRVSYGQKHYRKLAVEDHT